MSTQDFNSEEVLSGSYAFIGVSDDLSVSDPTIDWIAYRTDDITFGQDWETAEWTFPEQVGTVTQRLHNTRTLEFAIANHVGMTQLKDLGIVDPATNELKDTVTKDIQIRVFKSSPTDVANEADLHVDCYSAELSSGEIGFVSDGGTTSMTANLNGAVEMYDPAA